MLAEIADDETADKAFRNIEFELEEGGGTPVPD